MSRSIHQTFKSVFGGKSVAEIERVIEAEDPDLLAYLEKRRAKKQVRNLRELEKLAERDPLIGALQEEAGRMVD